MLRCLLYFGLAVCAGWSLCGCYAGAAGLVIGILSLDDSGSQGTEVRVVLPPEVTELRVETHDSPERISLYYVIAGKGEGSLATRIEYVPFRRGVDGSASQAGPALPATLATSHPLADPSGVAAVRVVWEAAKDLGGESALAQVVVTPLQNDLQGTPRTTALFHAGANQLLSVQEVVLTSEGGLISVSFELVDADFDPATLLEVELALLGEAPNAETGASFVPIPRPVFEGLAKSYPTAGPQRGARGSFLLRARDLRPAAPLRPLSEPGFAGRVAARLSFRDYPAAATAVGIGSFRYDVNDPPIIEVLPVERADLASGVIPIRYRGFDAQLNSLELQVELDTADGQGFRPAHEFPLDRSDGLKHLSTLPPELFGDQASPFHTYLWDALSQLRGEEEVTLALRGSDLEEGPRTVIRLEGISLVPLEKFAELSGVDQPLSLIARDFDRDGFDDLVIGGRGASRLAFFHGGAAGFERRPDLEVPGTPRALLAEDFDGDERLDLVVSHSSPGGTTVFGTESGQLSMIRDLVETEAPLALVAGDFNGDAVLDAAGALFLAGSIRLYLGSDGGPVSAGDLRAGERPGVLVASDFDGDAFSDVASANQVGDSVTLLRGSAAGLADAGEDLPAGDRPSVILAADLDADGLPDAATANLNSGDVTFLRGDRALGLVPVKAVRTGDQPTALAASDFDRDGIPDLAVACLAPGMVSILRGTRDGPAPDADLPAGERPLALGTGDLDGDGFPDLLAADRSLGQVLAFRGGRDGLVPTGRLGVGDLPGALATGDFDGDGLADAATADEGDSIVTVLRGDGGGPARGREIRIGNLPRGIASRDFDADGFADLLVANQISENLSLLRGGPAGLGGRMDLPAGKLPVGLAAADLDGDAFPDAVSTHQGSDAVGVFRGGPGGLEKVGEDIPVGQDPGGIAAVDLDGDGAVEVLVANQESRNLSRLQWVGWSNGALREAAKIPLGERYGGFQLADFNRDGFFDLVASSEPSGKVSYFPWDQRRSTFGSGQLLAEVGDPGGTAAGDFDGDRYLDLVVASERRKQLYYFAGGPERFQAREDLATGVGPISPVAGDLDGDGLPDLLVANLSDGSTAYFAGGRNGLVPRGNFEAGSGPDIEFLEDLDGDGFLDAFISLRHAAGVVLQRGGGEHLVRGRWLQAGTTPLSAVPGDFNGDGLLEVAIANSGSNDITYLGNRYLATHATGIPGAVAGGEALILIEPRHPPRYRLEIPSGALPAGTTACVIPTPVFNLPQDEAFRRGKLLVVVTAAVRLLRDGSILDFPALLSLKLIDPTVDPARLRLFHKDPSTPAGVEAVSPGMTVIDLDGGKWGQFPINRFESYLVAVEIDR